MERGKGQKRELGKRDSKKINYNNERETCDEFIIVY